MYVFYLFILFTHCKTMAILVRHMFGFVIISMKCFVTEVPHFLAKLK